MKASALSISQGHRRFCWLWLVVGWLLLFFFFSSSFWLVVVVGWFLFPPVMVASAIAITLKVKPTIKIQIPNFG